MSQVGVCNTTRQLAALGLVLQPCVLVLELEAEVVANQGAVLMQASAPGHVGKMQ